MKRQTYHDWEFIIWDDSPPEDNNQTYNSLLLLAETDFRIRVFKAPEHSGYIGEMKRLAASVAYGSYLVEIDHDDYVDPRLLQWTVDAARANPEAGFFILIVRGNKPRSSGIWGFLGFGYEVHFFQWSNIYDRFVARTTAALPNLLTLRHLVGMPNHVRIWKTEVYNQIGKHNPFLSVSDDYDLMVRTFKAGIRWCHIRPLGYFQYQNQDGNFTSIRNGLIQHNVYELYKHHKLEAPKEEYVVSSTNGPQWSSGAVGYFDEDPIHVEFVPEEERVNVVIVIPNGNVGEVLAERSNVDLIVGGMKQNWRIFSFGGADDINLCIGNSKWEQC